MKLMQINTLYKQGSTGHIVYEIDNAFKENNMGESRVVYYWGQSANSINAIKCGNIVYQKLMALKSRIVGSYGFVSKFTTYRTISEIKKFEPDIIHLHNIHDHCLDLKLFFSYIKSTNIKLVWTFHDCWAFTGYCAYYTFEKCDKWMTKCKNCSVANKFSWFHDNSLKLYEDKKELYGNENIMIVTPSEWLKNEVKKSFLSQNKVIVIHNGIDLSIFKPVKSVFKEKYDIAKKKMVLGVSYKWDKRKGIDTFFDIAKELGDDYVVVLVGEIEGEGRKIPRNIIHIERTEKQTDLVDIYSAADVFVNSSVEDNYPTVILEALACGTPVVTYDTGGCREEIDENCGILIEKNNIHGVIDGIKKIGVKNDVIIAACLKKAKDFNANDRYKEYLDLYKMI